MDEYAFAFVNQEQEAAEQAAIPEVDPIPALATEPTKIGPPIATVRRRANSLVRPRSRKHAQSRDKIDYEAKNIPRWYLEETFDNDVLEDNELLAARDIHIAHLASCRKVLDHASQVLKTLESIKLGFETVSQQTSTLQTSCTNLQLEELRLSALADDVKIALQPFSYLAAAQRLLNVPGSTLVLQASYQQLLRNLQTSLDFLDKHPDYKDAEFYNRQSRQALTKALTLARVHFTITMRDISTDITARTQANAMNKNTQSALLYTKFRSVVNHVRPLMQNIEDATVKHEEYWSLLNDCWLSYFSIRRTLLAPMMSNTFKEMANIADLTNFSTSAISFMRLLAIDERELFSSFFKTGKQEFGTYLGGLGQFFTDALRPRIAAEQSLNTLCEICSGMQAQCASQSEDAESVIFDMTPILATTMGEIQSRIVLKSQGVIITEIQGYRPNEKDLDYSAGFARRGRKHSRQVSNASQITSRNGSTPEQNTLAPLTDQADSVSISADVESLNSTVIHERWYITLRVSISLLSKIYKLVQSSIFDDLAHEVVRSCIASLLHASNQIRRRNLLDGQLFLLKHLIILKDQIATFDIEYSESSQTPGLDLSTVTGAFWDLTNRSTSELLAPTALFNLASSTISKLSAAGYLSRKVENMSDAREELDDQTRFVIGSLTLHCADSVTGPLKQAIDNKVQNARDLIEANRKFRASCPDSFELWRDNFFMFLDDERAVDTLLGIIQDKVLEVYERFDTYVREVKKEKGGTDEALAAIDLPSVMSTVDWLAGFTRL